MSGTDLANRVLAIPAGAGLESAWARREDESAAEHEALMAWLLAGEARGAPSDIALAARHEWAERAQAYQHAAVVSGATAPAMGAALVPITAEHVIVRNLMQLVQIETHKLLEQSGRNPQSVVGLKDLLTTINLVTELQKAGNAAASGQADTSKLTLEEKRLVFRAQQLLHGLK